MSIMTTQTAGRIAWALAGLAVTVVGLGLVLAVANGAPPSLADESLTLIPLAIGFPLVGALVASHQPGNAVAWVYLGGGLGAGLACSRTASPNTPWSPTRGRCPRAGPWPGSRPGCG